MPAKQLQVGSTPTGVSSPVPRQNRPNLDRRETCLTFDESVFRPQGSASVSPQRIEAPRSGRSPNIPSSAPRSILVRTGRENGPFVPSATGLSRTPTAPRLTLLDLPYISSRRLPTGPPWRMIQAIEQHLSLPPFGTHSVEVCHMKRIHRLAWAAMAALAFLSGCRSMDPCREGFFSRLTSRRATVIYDGPVSSTPLSGCCEGGPLLGDPAIVCPGSMISNGHGLTPVPALPATPSLPPGMLPSPTPTTSPPPLAPVPGSPPLATPTPAQPSARSK